MNTQQFLKKLANANTEEEVKNLYTRWLGIDLRTYKKIDCISEEVIWEFKYDVNLSNPRMLARVIAQALYYINELRYDAECPYHPRILAVADKNESFAIRMSEIDEILRGCDSGMFNGRASEPKEEIVNYVYERIKGCLIWNMRGDVEEAERFKDYISRNDSDIMKRVVQFDNFLRVYEKWKEVIGIHFKEREKLPLLFLKELSGDPCVVQFNERNGMLQILVDDEVYRGQIPVKEYKKFWGIWDRPVETREYECIVTNFDRLKDMVERRNTGSFFTPLEVVRVQMKYLREELGEGFEDRYYFWDPACGTGNLFYYFRNLRNVFLSTVDEREINTIVNNNLMPGAVVFQYDYLNDDIENIVDNEDLMSERWKMPLKLRKILKEEPDKLIILMNPPFGQAGGLMKGEGTSKGITDNKLLKKFKNEVRGLNNLANEFLYRSVFLHGLKVFTYGFLSFFEGNKCLKWDGYSIKHLSLYRGGIFKDISKNLCISFSFISRNTDKVRSENVVIDVYENLNGEVQIIKNKNCNCEVMRRDKLHLWIKGDRVLESEKVIGLPLCGPIKTPEKQKIRLSYNKKNSLGYMLSISSDFGHTGSFTALFSSCFYGGNGKFITMENFDKIMVVFSVRRIIAKIYKWFDRESYLYVPKTNELSEDFINDCLVYGLFDGKNYTSSLSDIEWGGRLWNIKNEFYPFFGNNFMNDVEDLSLRKSLQFSENRFVARWLKEHMTTPEARDVLSVGEQIYKYYYQKLPYLNKTKWKLDSWDVGWYQIRQALKEAFPKEIKELLKELKKKQDILQKKILEGIYHYEFVASEIG